MYRIDAQGMMMPKHIVLAAVLVVSSMLVGVGARAVERSSNGIGLEGSDPGNLHTAESELQRPAAGNLRISVPGNVDTERCEQVKAVSYLAWGGGGKLLVWFARDGYDALVASGQKVSVTISASDGTPAAFVEPFRRLINVDDYTLGPSNVLTFPLPQSSRFFGFGIITRRNGGFEAGTQVAIDCEEEVAECDIPALEAQAEALRTERTTLEDSAEAVDQALVSLAQSPDTASRAVRGIVTALELLKTDYETQMATTDAQLVAVEARIQECEDPAPGPGPAPGPPALRQSTIPRVSARGSTDLDD